MRKSVFLGLCAAMALVLSGCGGTGKPQKNTQIQLKDPIAQQQSSLRSPSAKVVVKKQQDLEKQLQAVPRYTIKVQDASGVRDCSPGSAAPNCS